MKLIPKLLLLVLFAFLLIPSGVSQIYYHKVYNVDEGLAQSQVLALFQDSKRNLWIGTNGGGLNIYNGHEFKSLTKEDGLIDNYVFSFAEDTAGNIWIGTNSGISVYDGTGTTNYTIDEGLPCNRVFTLICDSGGTVWIGTEKGVAYFQNGAIKIIEDELIQDAVVYTSYIDRAGLIWFGTINKGVIRYNPKTNKTKLFDSKSGLAHNVVFTIVQDSLDNIFIGTLKGLSIYQDDMVHRIKSQNTFRTSLLTKKGQLWFAKQNGILIPFSYDADNLGLLNADSLPSILFLKKFMTMIEDAEENIWIGTDSEGLIKFPNNGFYNYSVINNLQANDVYAICQDSEGKYWIGTSKKGLSCMRTTIVGNQIEYFKYKSRKDYYHENGEKISSIIGSRIAAIAEDKDSNIWVGTRNGLSIYNKKDSIFYNYTSNQKKAAKLDYTYTTYDSSITSDAIRSLLIDKQKNVWIGTDNGVTRYIDNSFSNFNLTYPILENINVWNIFEDDKSNLWFATDSGAYVYNNIGIKRLGKKDGFINDKVVSIVQDEQGLYWLGTKQGVYRYDLSSFKQIDRKKGLVSNNVLLLTLDDSNNLYVGTDKGLNKINLTKFNESGEIEIKEYGNLEGFIGKECNLNAVTKDSDGKLWFGTIKGATVFDPKMDKKNTIEPLTSIKSLRHEFKEFDWSPYCDTIDNATNLPVNLILPYTIHHLNFEFEATSLSIPEKVKYQFMLEPLDKDWSPALHKTNADYPTLREGAYTFKVRACNNDGVWNETPTTFKFIINPPFYRTWFFYITVFVLTIVSIIFFVKRREAHLKRDKLILERTVKERTEEVILQKEIVEKKNKDITDSINYAKNIQEAILPKMVNIESAFPDSFVLFKPRDIVSGDFYWMAQKDKRTFIAAADCTGHGVPGAFMSMLGSAFLNEIITNNPDDIKANEVLNLLRDNVIDSLHQTGGEGESKDGMDIALCIIDWEEKKLEFSGANNPLYLMRNNVLNEIKGDKMPIGYHVRRDPFKNHELDVFVGDTIYIFSDGFADQFGGPKGKKFKYKPFKKLFVEINAKSMKEQHNILEYTLNNWQGKHEQLDDVIVIGIKLLDEHFIIDQ